MASKEKPPQGKPSRQRRDARERKRSGLGALLAGIVGMIASACGGNEAPTEDECMSNPQPECRHEFPGGYAVCDSTGACTVHQWPGVLAFGLSGLTDSQSAASGLLDAW